MAHWKFVDRPQHHPEKKVKLASKEVARWAKWHPPRPQNYILDAAKDEFFNPPLIMPICSVLVD